MNKDKDKDKKNRIIYGHVEHRSGSGVHNSTPKRERTRNDKKRSWQKEYED